MKRLAFLIVVGLIFCSGCSSWFKGELTIINDSYRTIHEIYLGEHGFYKNINPGSSTTIKCDPGDYQAKIVGDNYTWEIASVVIERREETVLKIQEPTRIPNPTAPSAEEFKPVEYYPPAPQISAVVPPILLDIDWTDVIILPPWPTPTPDNPRN